MRLSILAASLLCSPAAGLRAAKPSKHKTGGPDELVLMHVPYNFGHTLEMNALLPIMPNVEGGFNGADKGSQANSFNGRSYTWGAINAMKFFKKDAEVWGHFHPDLQNLSEVTGCPMYFTPQKYWPKDLAKSYFQNKTRFGMLRDPYERLTAFFRGNFDTYGGSYPEYFKTCDVNSAVKLMLKNVVASADKPFMDLCTFIPQAEYFDGEYGINLPVDNRRFPDSINEVYEKYGYKMRITHEKIIHVRGCDNSWAGDFDEETRALVKKVYKRDFELLCKYFNYCDNDETVCMPGVPYMCPLDKFEWDQGAKHYKPKAAAQ